MAVISATASSAGGTLVLSNKEDSSLSILALSSASRRESGDLSASATLGFLNVFLPWVLARFERCPLGTIGRNGNDSGRLLQVIGVGATVESRRPLNSFSSEFFASAILKKLGMPSIQSQIVTAGEARALPGRFVVKAIAPDGHLHFVAGSDIPRIAEGDVVLVSELCADAASFDFVRRRILNKQYALGSDVFASLASKTDFVEMDRRAREKLAAAVGKTVESADDLFSEFRPTASELCVIEREMRLDGPQFLKICAVRTFGGSSFAHGGNVLITRSGKAISIDHSALFESGDDLRMLFRFTCKGTSVWKILCEIAKLTAADIADCIKAIPAHAACGDLAPLAPYFVERLRLWKKLAGEPATATASPAA